MSLSTTTSFDPAALRSRVMRDCFGFVTTAELAQLAATPASRLWPLLVRCGGCRFIAAAQDVQHLCAIIQADGRDYVRDVSFPALNHEDGDSRP
jgi:hypothetical protein